MLERGRENVMLTCLHGLCIPSSVRDCAGLDNLNEYDASHPLRI